MTTIQQTIEIPPDHRLRLDLPISSDIPAGRAEIRITITPHTKITTKRKPFEGLAGSLKNSPIFGCDGMELQRRIRDEW
ncbi:MAG: hypothetical protein FWG02_05695 [Holophagaceae bacterium]|nr:hypothetical protein [Holophagaceae bacterium]